MGHKPTPSENINNQTGTGIERANRGGIHRNSTRKKRKSGILNTLKGIMPEVGAVLGTKYENFNEIFQNLQYSAFQYVVKNYKKGVYLAPLIRKL